MAKKETKAHQNIYEQNQINRVMENSACGLMDVAERLAKFLPGDIDGFKSDYRIAKEQLRAIADNAFRVGINVNVL